MIVEKAKAIDGSGVSNCPFNESCNEVSSLFSNRKKNTNRMMTVRSRSIGMRRGKRTVYNLLNNNSRG